MDISSEEVATIQGKCLINKTIQRVGRFCASANKAVLYARVLTRLYERFAGAQAAASRAGCSPRCTMVRQSASQASRAAWTLDGAALRMMETTQERTAERVRYRRQYRGRRHRDLTAVGPATVPNSVLDASLACADVAAK